MEKYYRAAVRDRLFTTYEKYSENFANVLNE